MNPTREDIFLTLVLDIISKGSDYKFVLDGFEEVLPVHVAFVDVLPAVAPTHDVVNRSRILDSQLSWHGGHSGDCAP